MIRRVVCLLALVIQVLPVLRVTSVAYAVSPNLVIYQVQTGTTNAATQEYIALYNNAAEAIEVTGWCVTYGSASDATQTQLGCVTSTEPNIKVLLPSHTSLSLASSEFIAAQSGFVPDIVFSAGMSSTSGHVRILDMNKQEVDRLGWGSALHPEGTAIAAHINGKVLQRVQTTPDVLQDLDNNVSDFTQATLGPLPVSSLYEQEIPIDVCPNIEGLHIELPSGYLQDNTGNCYQDACSNLEGLQLDVPDGYQENGENTCQLIPLENSMLVINELLPNVTSYDTGKEFVEIYNPNSRPINLKGYVLQLAPSFDKSYALPDQVIQPGAYLAFSDVQTGLVLSNSSAELRLVAPNGDVVSQTDNYSSPGEDMAWALINAVWQYTNQPTPTTTNAASLEDTPATGDEEVSGLAPCPAGQYRNPETNRCRLLQSLASALTPCKAGQERNPETNRCRSVLAASTSLVPCNEGEERNPATNRCRLISSNELQPCDEGEQRNPETNRCRKEASATNADGIAKVKDVASNVAKGSIRWWLAGAATLAALGYAGYEWRRDIVNFIHRRRLPKTTK